MCRRRNAALLGLALSIIPAGIDQVEKYFGRSGAGIYVAGGIAALLATRVYLVPLFRNRVTTRAGWVLALATLEVLLFLLFLIYPLADSGIIGGGGDSDDALNVGVRALLNLQYPYRSYTPSGAPVTYFPGSLFLATPFVLLGSAAYQNWFWMAVFLVTMAFHLDDVRSAVLLFWITLLCSRVLQLMLTGGELLASSIYMTLFVIFAMRSVLAQRRRWLRWITAVLLGIGLSSRANYFLVAPVVFSAMFQAVGWKEAVKYFAVTIASFLAVTLPFALYDPQVFSVTALREQNFAAIELTTLLPGADMALPLLSSTFALVLSLKRMDNWNPHLLASCALVQAFPVAAIVLLARLDTRPFDISYAGYGVHFLFFGVLACWGGFVQSERIERLAGRTASGQPRTADRLVRST
jgi:hypothetical protein